MAAPTSWIWIAEKAGEPVGYVLAFIHERPENVFCTARRWLDIDQIAVRPDQRRHGVARSLVEAVRHAAEAHGIEEVELTCWTFNSDAQEAFRRLGFTPRIARFGWESGA